MALTTRMVSLDISPWYAISQSPGSYLFFQEKIFANLCDSRQSIRQRSRTALRNHQVSYRIVDMVSQEENNQRVHADKNVPSLDGFPINSTTAN